MAGSVALVTGSSSGLGRCIAENLAAQGHTVFASMRGIDGKNRAAADELRAKAASEGWALHPLELDVTDQASVDRAVAAVVERAGGIDIVVHNAGMGLAGVVEASTLAQVEQVFSTNAFSLLRVNQAVLPHMRQRRSGLLISIASISGQLYVPFYGVYGAAKGAFEALAEATHHEVCSYGVDSTIFQLGGYTTNFGANLQLADRVDTLADYGELGAMARASVENAPQIMANIGSPADVAARINEIIALPAGQRPLRVIMGAFSEGAVPIGELRAEAQAGMIAGMGMADVMRHPQG